MARRSMLAQKEIEVCRSDLRSEVTVDTIEVAITNPDRVLFPRDGYTKADLVDYYRRIAPFMLPHIVERPVTMVRYPRGIDSAGFFQKNAPRRSPPWLRRARMAKQGGFVDHIVCEKAADLVYLANLACITPHVWLSRVDEPERPDRMILDLDPGRSDFELVKETALFARRILAEDGLSSYVMTTGSKGLHVVVPLDRTASFEAVRSYALRVVEEMIQADDRLTAERSIEEREGRLLVDVFRNAYAQTGVAPYAVRPRDGAPVATPLRWEELDDPELSPRSFTIRNVLSRAKDDPWRDIALRPGRPPEP